MDVGGLDQQIRIQTQVETRDRGALNRTYVDDSPPDIVWAAVISQKGDESFQAARQNARETIRVKIRWRTDITDKHRIVWRGQNYSIKYVDKSQRRKGELWLTAECVGAT